LYSLRRSCQTAPKVARQLEEQKKAEENKGKEDDNVFSTQVEGEKMDVVDTSGKNDEPPSGLGPEY
jgi:transcription initiation factor IIF auxiliary subunit